MSALQEISGTQFWRFNPAAAAVIVEAPAFPGNSASGGTAPNPPSHYTQIESQMEVGWQSNFHQSGQLYRSVPRRGGATADILWQAHDFWRTSRQHSADEVDRLKTMYQFQDEESVAEFLSSHRNAGSVLIAALPHLQNAFGPDVVFNLEAVKEDDEPPVLYAVAIWRGPVEGAVGALENFDENWWLDQPTQGLALIFTYELA